VLEWAIENNATVYCHWFQPIAGSGFRHGQTGQVQIKMIEFDKDGLPMWDFKGKNLLRGETDGSSYPNGGLRATHRAGAYLVIDTTSPIMLRGDTIFIPACMISYRGHALDEKTPLLRSQDALSREGTRLLKLLGYNVKGLQTNIGLEQEFFLIPRDAYNRRPDLQLAGRTVIGKMPARGQELGDHYMAPPSHASPALAAIQELQQNCFKMGIPMKTRHREVAPNQYEIAPLFGFVTTQIDQNLIVMQMLEEVAANHGLVALLQEKPFQGVNGSGKHNNWSIGTTDGTNLFNVPQLTKNSGNPDIFPVIMAAVIKGIHDYGDMMRMAIATPGNDFRLGACEAPPAIFSSYLGEDMTKYLEGYKNGENAPYNPVTRVLDLGASALPPLELPNEDRNRTSPFPYGGHRFEFRSVGSSQNVSFVNTILSTVCAKTFKEFADAIEGGENPKDVARKALNSSWKVIFNGNGYDKANQEALTKAGLWRIDSGVEAICRLTHPKNVELFSSLNIISPEECEARENALLCHYTGTVEIEAGVLVDMLNQYIIPAVKGAGVGSVKDLEGAATTLSSALKEIHNADSAKAKALLARKLRLETMIELRELIDNTEAIVPANLWPIATYKELLFLDQHREE
jgi:glutamine synthetase